MLRAPLTPQGQLLQSWCWLRARGAGRVTWDIPAALLHKPSPGACCRRCAGVSGQPLAVGAVGEHSPLLAGSLLGRAAPGEFWRGLWPLCPLPHVPQGPWEEVEGFGGGQPVPSPQMTRGHWDACPRAGWCSRARLAEKDGVEAALLLLPFPVTVGPSPGPSQGLSSGQGLCAGSSHLPQIARHGDSAQQRSAFFLPQAHPFSGGPGHNPARACSMLQGRLSGKGE